MDELSLCAKEFVCSRRNRVSDSSFLSFSDAGSLDAVVVEQHATEPLLERGWQLEFCLVITFVFNSKFVALAPMHCECLVFLALVLQALELLRPTSL